MHQKELVKHEDEPNELGTFVSLVLIGLISQRSHVNNISTSQLIPVPHKDLKIEHGNFLFWSMRSC